MTKEEIKNWFWNKFNLCYPVKHDDYKEKIYMFYDDKFVRQMKLCKISNKDIKLPNKIKGICLFELDFKNNYFWYDYDEIYQFLYENYNYKKLNINDLLSEILKEDNKLSVLTSFYSWPHLFSRLKENNKLSVLTSSHKMATMFMALKEDNKLSVLTSWSNYISHSYSLKEDNKLSVLTSIVMMYPPLAKLKEDNKLSVLTSRIRLGKKKQFGLKEDNKLSVY